MAFFASVNQSRMLANSIIPFSEPVPVSFSGEHTSLMALQSWFGINAPIDDLSVMSQQPLQAAADQGYSFLTDLSLWQG